MFYMLQNVLTFLVYGNTVDVALSLSVTNNTLGYDTGEQGYY